MARVTLALIGAGAWGEKIINTCKTLKDVRLKYICAKSENTLRTLASEYVTTTSYQQLFNYPDIGGVIIATPASTHYLIAKDCLQHKLGVLIEKPFVTSWLQAIKLKKLQQANKVGVMIGHIDFYNPAYLTVKKLLPIIGQIRYVVFEGTNNGPYRDDISALGDWAPHGVSMCVDLLRKQPGSVAGWEFKTLRPKTEFNDMAWVKLMFSGNRQAFLKLTWLAPVKKRELTIVGQRGAIVFDDVAVNKVTLYQQMGPKIRGEKIMRQEPKVSYPAYAAAAPLKLELEEFARYLQQPKVLPKSSLDHGLMVAKLIELVETSAKRGGKLIRTFS